MPLKGFRWVVMSYGIFREDFDGIFVELGREHPHIIVDEATALKNSGSILYRRVNALSAGGPLQLLTGTPTNKPTDAYAYVKLTTPECLPQLHGHFESLHVAERDFFGNITAYQHLDVLNQNLMLQALKRTKTRCSLGSSKPRYDPIFYDLSAKHKKLYNQLAEEQLLLHTNRDKIRCNNAATAHHALRQIVVNFDYFSGDSSARSAVYDLIDNTIEDTECLRLTGPS